MTHTHTQPFQQAFCQFILLCWLLLGVVFFTRTVCSTKGNVWLFSVKLGNHSNETYYIYTVVSDIAVFVLKRDVKLQPACIQIWLAGCDWYVAGHCLRWLPVMLCVCVMLQCCVLVEDSNNLCFPFHPGFCVTCGRSWILKGWQISIRLVQAASVIQRHSSWWGLRAKHP